MNIREMRGELRKAHREGLADEAREISEVAGAPKDATQVFLCYLGLEAARGSHAALVACNALNEYIKDGG